MMMGDLNGKAVFDYILLEHVMEVMIMVIVIFLNFCNFYRLIIGFILFELRDCLKANWISISELRNLMIPGGKSNNTVIKREKCNIAHIILRGNPSLR